jgi:bifunctional non-homologous end joining protein LigD
MAVSACNLCESTDDPKPFLEHPNWAVEQKLDGIRICIQANNGTVRVLNRQGQETSKPIPRAIRQAMASLPGEWTFDGELVGYTFWIFDLLEAPGAGDIMGWSWIDRRTMLDKLFATAPNIPACLRTAPWESDPAEKMRFYAACLVRHVEGVVFKKMDAPYRDGRTTTWLKCKFQKTCEVVVTELNRNGKPESIGLGLYDTNGKLVECSGARLLPRFMGQFTAHDPSRGIDGTVIEVRYLYSNDGIKIVQPHILKIRDDKKPADCTQSQLIMTTREVLTSGPSGSYGMSQASKETK